ncbi:hypothetical protein quinque_006499 [Culex quinquefasciatus]
MTLANRRGSSEVLRKARMMIRSIN